MEQVRGGLYACGTALIVLLMALLMQMSACALTLDVSYTEPTCSEDMVFTLSSDGTDQCVYALNSVVRKYPEDSNEEVLMVDPSQGQYKMTYSSDNAVRFRFRCSGTYILRFYVMDKGTQPFRTARKTVTVVIDEASYPSAELIAQSVVEECLAAGCSTEYEKALWLHDWLIHNSAYDSTYTYCSAEAALTKNRGTCESYHRAYEMLLSRAGIESARVVANGHVWTGVRIDGQWTQVDVTWDDMGDSYNGTFWEHLYFGLTDELMRMAHSDHTADSAHPCTTLDLNYFIHEGAVTQWTEPLITAIEHGTGAERTVDMSQSYPPSTMQLLTPIIAYALNGKTVSDAVITDVQVKTEALSVASVKAVFTVTLADCVYACTLPKDLTVIGEGAFEGTDMETVRIPSGAIRIESRAFADSALKKIRVPESVESISDDAFEGITSLTIVCAGGSEAESFAKAHGFDTVIVYE